MSELSQPSRGPGVAVAAVSALALVWLAFDDVGFRDSGELGTAAYGLGVAHPTGFAVDLLLLRAASWLPLGPIAFRQNVCVALAAAAALGLLAELCDVLARSLGVEQRSARWLGAVLAASGLLGWQTFMGTALATEVYSLALAAGLLAAWGAARGGTAAGLGMLVIGFAPGLHVTAGLFAVLALLVFVPERGPRAALRFALPRLPIVLAGALIIAYLPLASWRQPALDWGDPEDLGRVLAHLTAARIRSAYHGEMLSADASGSTDVIAQWLELWPVLPLALVALAMGTRRRPLAVLAPLSLCTADLAYSVFVNPMGAVDRQVGHMAGAGLCVLAGLGAALIASALQARSRSAFAVALAAVLALSAVLVARLPRAELRDGYAAGELLGSGGPLAALPPRGLLLCTTDDACAGGLFALHVERVRPDVEVLPAQHLWDATVLRRLRGHPDPSALLPRTPRVSERGAAAQAVLSALLVPGGPRPVLLETREVLAGTGGLMAGAALPAPYFRAARSAAASAPDASALARLDRMRRARLDDGRPSAERARYAWSRAYSALGEQAFLAQPALSVRALREAVQLAPQRAAAWVSLGAALEADGNLDAALDATEHAVRLAPERATGWVNLVRFTLQRRGPAAASDVLRLAERAGVHDPRLDALAHTLAQAAR
jgi:hypothetical protein